MEGYVLYRLLFGVTGLPPRKTRTIDIQPGEFGAHIGYAPELKSNFDPKKSYDWNVNMPGYGQLGQIMGRFQYYQMKENVGLAQAGSAPWDRKIWDDTGSVFEAPTIRSAVDVINTVQVAVLQCIVSAVASPAAGALVGMLNMVDDVAFNTLDYSGGYKTQEEMMLANGKAAATAALSCIPAGGGAAGAASNFAVTAMKTTGRAVLNNIANSAIQSVNLNEGGGLYFDTDMFVESSFGEDAMLGYVTTMISSGVSAGLGDWTKGFVDNGNQKMASNVAALNSVVTTGVDMGLDFAINGEATLNIGNISGLMTMFAEMGDRRAAAEDGSRTDGIGFAEQQSRDRRQRMRDGMRDINIGALELTFGKNGVSSRFGTGGHTLSIKNLVSAVKGFDGYRENIRMGSAGIEGDLAIGMRSLYSSGIEEGENLYNDILSGTALVNITEGLDGAAARTTESDGRRIIDIDRAGSEGLNMGVVLMHEAMRNGYDDGSLGQIMETRNAARSHMAMAGMIADTYGISALNDFNQMEAMSYMTLGNDQLNSYIDGNYDSSADYWKLITDESGNNYLEYDGRSELYDEEGNFITKIDGWDEGDVRLQTSIMNYLGLGSLDEAKQLMLDSGLTTVEGTDFNWHNDEANMGKRISIGSSSDPNMTDYLFYAIEGHSFLKDSIAHSQATGESIVDVMNQRVHEFETDRVTNGDPWHQEFSERKLDMLTSINQFISGIRPMDDEYTKSTQDMRHVPEGDECRKYYEVHPANDRGHDNDNIYSIFSGKVKLTREQYGQNEDGSTDFDRGAGKYYRIENGFNIDNTFISMGFYTQGFHNSSFSADEGDFLYSGGQVSISGGTGAGPKHSHTESFTLSGANNIILDYMLNLRRSDSIELDNGEMFQRDDGRIYYDQKPIYELAWELERQRRSEIQESINSNNEYAYWRFDRYDF